MDPRDVLAAICRAPAKAAPDKGDQGVEDPTSVRTHDHRGAQLDLPRARGERFVYRSLPRECDFDAEPPGVGSVGFAAADHTAALVVRLVVTVGINRCGACL